MRISPMAVWQTLATTAEIQIVTPGRGVLTVTQLEIGTIVTFRSVQVSAVGWDQELSSWRRMIVNYIIIQPNYFLVHEYMYIVNSWRARFNYPPPHTHTHTHKHTSSHQPCSIQWQKGMMKYLFKRNNGTAWGAAWSIDMRCCQDSWPVSITKNVFLCKQPYTRQVNNQSYLQWFRRDCSDKNRSFRIFPRVIQVIKTKRYVSKMQK